MSILPQAPEEAGVAECIVLTEAVAQGEIDPAGPENPQSTVPLATQARPVVVAVVAHTLATAVSGTSSDSQRPPVQWRVGIPIEVPRLGHQLGLQELGLEALPTSMNLSMDQSMDQSV